MFLSWNKDIIMIVQMYMYMGKKWMPRNIISAMHMYFNIFSLSVTNRNDYSLSECVFLFQYLRLARTMKYYGYIQFKPCVTDYPHPHSRVFVAAGHRELNFRIQTDSVSLFEYVTLFLGLHIDEHL